MRAPNKDQSAIQRLISVLRTLRSARPFLALVTLSFTLVLLGWYFVTHNVSPVLFAVVVAGITIAALLLYRPARSDYDLRSTSDPTLQVLIQSSPLAIIALDADKKVTIWNTTAERLFGW